MSFVCIDYKGGTDGCMSELESALVGLSVVVAVLAFVYVGMCYRVGKDNL